MASVAVALAEWRVNVTRLLPASVASIAALLPLLLLQLILLLLTQSNAAVQFRPPLNRMGRVASMHYIIYIDRYRPSKSHTCIIKDR